ncbi:hypothetical protein AYO38_04055 [bacterium SCGC AG-212-C10]|nr:hypothetical protein AYO38_04055 [bacterium SCGC AG-212-C10]
MRPDPPRILQGIGISVLTAVTPEVQTAFGQSLSGMAGMLNLMIAQEFDRMADRLLTENAAIVGLLEDASPLVDPPLQTRIAACPAELQPANYLVSTLQSANDRLRAVLIDVHAAVVALPGDDAAKMNERIWDELRESTRRRHIVVPR